MLIAARLVQGGAGALVSPAALSLLTTTNAEGPARTLPAPPGTGGGQGGSVFDPSLNGSGSNIGQLGGMGGIANMGGFAGRSGATREKMLQEGGGNALSE